jgi:hypothetical protein
MDSNTPDADAKTRARRRLLRGSFSVPAVLTLASGSALAATSTTCLAKATKESSTAPLTNGSPTDTFLRVRLVAYTVGSTTKHAVTRLSFGAIPVNTAFWTSSVAWQEFDVAQNKVVAGTEQTGAIPGTTSTSNYYVALRLNASGEIVGVGLSGSGSVVGSSCWTSMKMAGP